MHTIYTLSGYLFAILLLDGLGKVILPESEKNSFFLRISFGIIAFSIVLTIIGFLNLLDQKVILMLAFGVYLLLLPTIKSNLLNYLNIKPHFSLLLLLISAYVVIVHINAFTPPLSRDALNYHLYLPKIYLKQNSIITIPNNIYSFFPAYWEVFYTLLLTISNDITAKLFHALFLILTISLIIKILKLLKPSLRKVDAYCAVLIFISAPSITKTAGWAYLDITFTFYCLLSLYLILKFYRQNQKSSYYLAAISAGFALGLKYLGWLWILCLGLLFLEEEKTGKMLFLYFKFVLIAALISCPFYLRNFFVTGGNPFYPFFSSLFSNKYISPEKYHLLTLYFKSYGRGINFRNLLFLPYRILFCSEFAQPQNFDGKIGFLFLLGLIPVFKNIKFKFSPRSIAYIAIIYILCWFILSQQLRFLIPALALVAIIYGLYIGELRRTYFHYLIFISALVYLFYPIQDSCKFKPYKFILGKESRDEFLRKNLRIYPMIEFINKNLPLNSKVMLLDIGAIAYYVDKEVYQESIFEDYTFKLNLSISAHTTASFLKNNRVDFILMDEEFLRTYVLPVLKTQELKNLKRFYSEYLKPVCRYQNFILYQLTSI